MSDVFISSFEENSLAYIVLRHWMPTVISIVLGGAFAVVVFPRWQDRYLRQKSIEEKKFQLKATLLVRLDAYITEWRRLMDHAQYEQMIVNKIEAEIDETVIEELDQQKEAAVAKKMDCAQSRSQARDQLMAALAQYSAYCGGSERSVLEDFRSWDEARTKMTLDELPPISRWRDWERLFAET